MRRREIGTHTFSAEHAHNRDRSVLSDSALRSAARRCAEPISLRLQLAAKAAHSSVVGGPYVLHQVVVLLHHVAPVLRQDQKRVEVSKSLHLLR